MHLFECQLQCQLMESFFLVLCLIRFVSDNHTRCELFVLTSWLSITSLNLIRCSSRGIASTLTTFRIADLSQKVNTMCVLVRNRCYYFLADLRSEHTTAANCSTVADVTMSSHISWWWLLVFMHPSQVHLISFPDSLSLALWKVHYLNWLHPRSVLFRLAPFIAGGWTLPAHCIHDYLGPKLQIIVNIHLLGYKV